MMAQTIKTVMFNEGGGGDRDWELKGFGMWL